MHLGNVINFPGKRGVSGMGGTPVEVASDAPGAAEAAGTPAPVAPLADALTARMSTTLELARRATIGLVGRSVPGSIELGLFNQYGIIQNALAQLAARIPNATSEAELAAIGQDLESVEKQTTDYATAVDSALTNAPDVPTIASNKKQLWWWIGGSVLTLLVAAGAFAYLRKPARRRKLAGFFGVGATATAPAANEPRTKKPKKRGGRRLKKK